MESFGYRTSYRYLGFVSSLRPVAALVGLGVLYFILVAPGKAKFEWWVPLAALGLVGWLVWDLVEAVQRAKFRIAVSEDSIQIGNAEAVRWQDVERADLGAGLGKDAVITLHTKSGSKVCVPAAIEGLPYITGVVRKHVESISE